MRNRKTRAFSLTEMLIVLAVMGVLVSMIVPTAIRIPALARRAHCSANLRHLGQAYAAYCANVLTATPDLGPYAWSTTLKPYLGDNSQALYCPEDEYPHHGMPDMRLDVSYFGLGSDHMPNSRALFGRFPYWEEGPSGHPGPGIWKLNDEDYQTFTTNPDGADATDLLPRYTPGKNPKSYYLVIEEGLQGEEASSDYDYDDLIIHVTELDDNRFSMTFEKQWYFANYALFDANGDQIGDSSAQSLGVPGNSGPFEFPFTGKLSYGFNWRVTMMPRGVHKVLAVDYDTEAVHVGGDSTSNDDWADAPARHLGRINVLFADGAVVSHTLDEIDPGEPGSANDLNYWDPRTR